MKLKYFFCECIWFLLFFSSFFSQFIVFCEWKIHWRKTNKQTWKAAKRKQKAGTKEKIKQQRIRNNVSEKGHLKKMMRIVKGKLLQWLGALLIFMPALKVEKVVVALILFFSNIDILSHWINIMCIYFTKMTHEIISETKGTTDWFDFFV